MKIGLIGAGVIAAGGMSLVAMTLFVGAAGSSAAAACTPDGVPIAGSQAVSAQLPKKVADTTLDEEQRTHASVIVTVGLRMKVAQPGLIAAIAVAMHETTLHKTDTDPESDRTYQGLFQQDAGHGSALQRQNPVTASTTFFKAVKNIKGYKTMQPSLIGALAQGMGASYTGFEGLVPFATSVVAKALSPTAATDLAAPIAPTTSADTLVWPVGKNAGLSSNFGEKGPWSLGYHTGQDFQASEGTPVHTAHAGTVTFAGDSNSPYGIDVEVKFEMDGRTWFNRYAHLSKVLVKTGDTVAAGKVLGMSGSTGNVTGPHLHFELIPGDTDYHHAIDPMPWLKGKAIDAPPDADGTSYADPVCSEAEEAIAGPAINVPPGGTPMAQAAVRFALSQRGKPYNSNGAHGLESYGCNGFVWRAWHEAGSKWPEMIVQYMADSAKAKNPKDRWLMAITEADAQPGDIIMQHWNNGTGTGHDYWDHVGLVVDPGGKRFIEAQGHQNGVTVSKWTDQSAPRSFWRMAVQA